MRIARIQQCITLSVLAAAWAWWQYFWPAQGVVAWLGLFGILSGYSVVLAAEFVALWRINRADPVGPATWPQLARAWLGETLTAPQVFGWRQPFRSHAEPDYLPANTSQPGPCGVVLIHGFFCNRGLWAPWLAALRLRGHPFVAVNLEPIFGSIDSYVPLIEQAVLQVTQATGRAPVLVCHSMGGLAARAWLRAHQSSARVAHVITIGTPHHGTWLGRFSHAANGRQMRLGSRWLQTLAAQEPVELSARFTCWYSNCDNIVFPASKATLDGADNQWVSGSAHVQLAFNEQVMRASLAKIATL